jgi:hypothetical protein
MEVLKSLKRIARPADGYAVMFLLFSVIYALFWGTRVAVAVGLAFGLIVYGALPKQLTLAILVAASVVVLLQRRKSWYGSEGFAGSGPSGVASAGGGASGSAGLTSGASAPATATGAATVAFTNPDGSNGSKPMLPDHTDRKEPLVLGQAYKLPSEADDKGYHLDAGTTFLNAYKALKPDQIAAMTRDTQELLATQKSLMQMLDSFGPLMKDMGKITGFFNQVPSPSPAE